MDNIDKIIAFAKEKRQTDVNSHRGAYQNIIDYCEALKTQDVNLKDKQITCDMCGSTKLEHCCGDEYSCEECGHYPIIGELLRK